MDGLADLMNRWIRADVTVLADGDKLRIRGPKSAEPIVREILARKEEVLSIFYPSTEELLDVARVCGYPSVKAGALVVAATATAWSAATRRAKAGQRRRLYEALEEWESRASLNGDVDEG